MKLLWMLGHSNRSLDQLVELVVTHRIAHVVDVRAHPASRRHPHFDRLELETRLPARGIAYSWMPALGGMRQPLPGSKRNAAWTEEGFRAYADHMQSTEFLDAWRRLAHLAAAVRCAAMCAEAQPLRCHRQLLADAFVARGWEVRHLIAQEQEHTHRLTPTAVVDASGGVSYPGVPELPFGASGT